MSGEMDSNRMKQVVRTVAIEKTSAKREQIAMAAKVLREAFHENVTDANFKWENAKLSEEVKNRYVGRMGDCD